VATASFRRYWQRPRNENDIVSSFYFPDVDVVGPQWRYGRWLGDLQPCLMLAVMILGTD
jgi:hypothetical protein